jgi:hypothetical protein
VKLTDAAGAGAGAGAASPPRCAQGLNVIVIAVILSTTLLLLLFDHHHRHFWILCSSFIIVCLQKICIILVNGATVLVAQFYCQYGRLKTALEII